MLSCELIATGVQVFLRRQGVRTGICTMHGIADHAGSERRLWIDIADGRLPSIDSGSGRQVILMRGGRLVFVSLKLVSARVGAAAHALDRFKQNPFKQGSR
jgi:hypothetical protein